MIRVAYYSPFVPPEWLAAHRVQPVWLPGLLGGAATAVSGRRGVCSCADVLLADAWRGADVQAVVLTTICDQMRYAAACLEDRGEPRVFLLNVPSTWQGPAVRQLYRDELQRLGRFLVALGGQAPTAERLERMMERYERVRAAARDAWPAVKGDLYRQRLDALRSGTLWTSTAGEVAGTEAGVPLALVGGPLLGGDYALVDLVGTAGGRIVLDASEWGERTLPAPLRRQGLASDPLGELVRTYFDEIPDVFRRPNTRLYDWLGAQLAARRVRGILYWRRLFCDLWHAELDTMRRWSPVPVLDVDASDGDPHSMSRTLARCEAFLEMLP